MAFLLLLPTLLLPTPTLAWGAMGHQAIAYIAQDFVSIATKSYVQNILSDTSTNYMASVATWADSYRSQSGGGWSSPLHYIDAEDSPPQTCNVQYSRDCEGGCVVSAIQNFTTQLKSSGTSASRKVDAMKFIIHFVGDVHQPLHNEAIDVGGNSIDVTYSSKSTNLHAVWDTSIPQAIAGGSSMSVARSWATTLTKNLKAGSYGSNSSLNSGIDINDPQGTALVWSSQANGYVCTEVIPDGVDAVEGQELSGSYYNSHRDAVEVQVARAGYRLATWLNLIATGKASG